MTASRCHFGICTWVGQRNRYWLGVSIPSREGALYESHLGMLRIALCCQYTQHTQRDRSRGIRDEATACEPEVVSRERTWPPLPVAQPSRATERPFGTKYNIDQNKAKKEGPGGARGQTGSRNMAATRFFRLGDPNFLSNLQHITVSISYRYPVLQC